jgi:zinc protease
VAADILGGGFSSRLFQKVRTELGYAYNIGASWGANYEHPGLFEISGSTQSKYTVATIQTVLAELNRLRAGEVTDEELKTAKDTVLNSFVFFFDRPNKTLNRLLIYAYYGYPKDFIFQYQKALGSVTKADVLRVAKKYLRPEDLTVVAVGNPKEFATPISELGLKVQPLDLTIPEPKHEETKSDAASGARGKQLLDEVRQALGGEKVISVKDVDYTVDVDIQSPGGAMKVTQHNIFLLPSSLRQEVSMPFGKQTVYSDGASGWIAAPQGTQAMPPAVLKQVRGETFRLLYRLVRSDKAVYAAENTLEFSDGQGNRVRMVVDPKTGLPLKLAYESAAMNGPAQVEETFSGWQDVNGIKVPFGRSVTQDGKKFIDVHVRDYKINTGVTPEQLSRKP